MPLECLDPHSSDSVRHTDTQSDHNGSIGTESDCDSNSPNQTVSDKLDYVPLSTELKLWYNKHNVSLSMFKGLLTILRPYHPELPKDPRTIFGTYSTFPSSSNGEGSFVYFGLEKVIRSHFDPKLYNGRVLSLNFNFDGVPIYKSTGKSFWPILCSITNYDLKMPLIIGIYCGKQKPDVHLYLDNFCKELDNMISEGLLFEDIVYEIEVRAIICDAPAKAFIKQIKTHGGYFACDKCTVKGIYSKTKMSMSYSKLNNDSRTDLTFREKVQKEHHVGDSPFLFTRIDMISSFPVDYMHCILLGICRKLLNAWFNIVPFKLSSHQKKLIENVIPTVKENTPIEFTRQLRSFKELDRFKATEYRQILLYTGPFIFKNILKDKYYKHFLLLFYIVRILCNPHAVCIDSHLLYADQLVKLFIKQFSLLYGKKFTVVYNIHMLSHIVDDCRQLGTLDSFSAFQYENMLGQIKKKIRSSNLPLSQISRRIHEGFGEPEMASQNYSDNNGTFYIKGAKVIPKTFKDSCVMLKDYSIGLVQDLLPNGVINLKKFNYQVPAFDYPSNSEIIDVYSVGEEYTMKTINKNDIINKCMILPSNRNNIVLPLL